MHPAPRTWQLQSAKNRFSEVVKQARSEGPQIVTLHGRKAAVVVSIEDYLELTGQKEPVRSFAQVLLSAPKVRGGLRLGRREDVGRKVELG